MIEMLKELPLSEIEIDRRFHARADPELDPDHVESMVRNPETLPPLHVVQVADRKQRPYILIGGFHEIGALFRLGRETFLCRIRDGTEEDALLWSRGENIGNAKSRTPQDMRHTAYQAFEERKKNLYAKLTDTAIAKEMRVDQSWISRLRQSWEENMSQHKKTQKPSKNGKSAAGSNGDGEKDADEDAPFRADPPDFERAKREAAEIRAKIEKESEEEKPEHLEGCREIVARATEDRARMLIVLGQWNSCYEKADRALWRAVRAKKRTRVRTPK